VLAELRNASGEGAPELFLCDRASLSDVHAAAAELARRTGRLEPIVNSAGAIYGRREVTLDVFERTFARNRLGPSLLTNLLLPLVERAAPSRGAQSDESARRPWRLSASMPGRPAQA
jgi:NAD(P)-dependent dehydrogenase (short-subunit alcohol dehydrogenase family)